MVLLVIYLYNLKVVKVIKAVEDGTVIDSKMFCQLSVSKSGTVFSVINLRNLLFYSLFGVLSISLIFPLSHPVINATRTINFTRKSKVLRMNYPFLLFITTKTTAKVTSTTPTPITI